MIPLYRLREIGSLGQPHGIRGEINAEIDGDIDPTDLGSVFVPIDGLMVPFAIERSRSRGREAWLLKFEEIDDEPAANAIKGVPIYIESDLDAPIGDADDGFYAEQLIGFTIVDGDNTIGVIADVDDSTENALFVVDTHTGHQVLIPIADEMIVNIDVDGKVIEMNLPEGLLEM